VRNHPLSRRYPVRIQIPLALLAVLAVLGISGGLAPPRGLLITSAQPLANLDLHASLTIPAAARAHAAGAVVQVTNPVQAFEALNRRAGGTLTVAWDGATGVPRFLTGGSSTVRIPYLPTAAEQGNPVAMALGFLDENRALFKLRAAAEDFGPSRMEADKQLGFSHVRLPQVHHGIPVYGRELVVHFDPGGQIVAVNGGYAPGLSVPAEPSISGDRAEQVALSDLKQNQLDAKESASVQATVLKGKTALTVYVAPNGKATLTWAVKVATTSPLGQWTFFVNARRPVVVHAVDTVANAKDRRTYSSRTGNDIPGRLLAQEGERASDPVGQAAHDGAGKVYDYYFNTFKRDSIDGHGMPIVSTVHYGTDQADAENAAWVGEAQQMVYGDGGEIFKPLAYGLDVVGHELTHGVTEATANLIYEGQSGALNESYSDVFGVMIDRANWTLGEQIVRSPPFPVPYLRDLQDPHLGDNYDPNDPLSGAGQPAHMDEYANLPISRRYDYGGVHVNSGIPNHVAYLLAQAIGREKTEQIYYRTLTQYLAPDSDFQDAARASVQAATDLYGATEVTAVWNAFGQVGIGVAGAAGTPPTPPPSTPTAGGTTPVPSQNLPAGCRDLIVNGTFETNAGWQQRTSSDTEIIDPQLPRTGNQSAWLGGTDAEALQYMFQDVRVPANATSVQLSYYRLLHEEFSGALGALLATEATFDVIHADTSGNQVATFETLSSTQGDDTWRQARFDLSRYAGRTVRLVFNASNPTGNVSSMFVDDVSLVACTTGQAQSTPAPPSGNRVYVAGHILDSDTERGIPGAQIFILRQGLSATAAARDDQITDDEVLTYGTADNNGAYQTLDPIPKGRTYSVILTADGYLPVIANNSLPLSNNAPNPTKGDAIMRPAR
jgi:Zn-dependent metalloprotease